MRLWAFGAFGLAIMTGILAGLFGIWQASAATSTISLRPDSTVTGGWATTGGTPDSSCTGHCDYVDEPLDGSGNGDGDGSYLQSASNGSVEEYSLQNITGGQRATNVQMRIYYTKNASSLFASNMRMNVRVNDTLQTEASEVFQNTGGTYGVYKWFEADFAAPSGGWTQSDIDSLQAWVSPTNTLTGGNYRLSTIETKVTWESPDLTEDASRVYGNTDSATPGTPLAATDTPAEVQNNSAFRIRLGITPSLKDWLSGSWGAHNNEYNLQYATKTETTCAAQASGWGAVQVGSGLVRWYDNASVTDGASISSYVDDPTTSGTIDHQTYKESNSFTLANDVTAGDTALWDFSLQVENATPGDAYCFRVVQSDGSLLSSYSAYPEITVVGDYGVTVVDADGAEVVSPSVAFPSTQISTSCQTIDATLGVSSQKVRIQNDQLTNGWDVSIAATDGSGALWDSGALRYDFNDIAECSDDIDADSYGGVMRIDPTSATVAAESGCANTGVSVGSQSAFIEGSVDAVSLVSADNTSERFCYWDVTGIGIQQEVPAATGSGSYTIDMTITMTAQ